MASRTTSETGGEHGRGAVADHHLSGRSSEVSAVTEILQAKVNPAVTFRIVETEMRRRNYGVLSTGLALAKIQVGLSFVWKQSRNQGRKV